MQGTPKLESLVQLGRFLSRLRVSRGYSTQSSFAIHSTLPVKRVRDIETGKYLGSNSDLEKYVRSLGSTCMIQKENGFLRLEIDDQIITVEFDESSLPQETHEYRKRLGMNINDFSTVLRISAETVSLFEQSRLPNHGDITKRIRAVVHGEVNIDSLIDGRDIRTLENGLKERSFLNLPQYLSSSIWIMSAGLLPRFSHSNYLVRLRQSLERGAEHYYFVPQNQYTTLGTSLIRSVEETISLEDTRDRLRIYVAPPICFLLGQEIAVLHPQATDKRKVVVTNWNGVHEMPPHKYFDIFCYLREVVVKLDSLFAEGKQNRAYHGFYRCY